MKKHLYFILLLTILVSGCSQEEFFKKELTNGKTFTASFEQKESRTYVEEGNLLRWTKGDLISLFNSNTLNQQYKFDGETGSNSGTFSKVEDAFGTGNDLNCHYAVYPYASDIAITESGVITATLPATQSYAVNSFGLGANTMVAITQNTDDTFLKFKNIGGYLKLQLYGDDVTVKSITLTGNNNEKLAGTATITPVYGQSPTISMATDATESITLDCGEGVKIGSTAETATAFWIVVPPTTFENGFEITITDVNDNKFTKSTSNEISIERNVIKPMAAFEVEMVEVIPNNQIWYTTSNGDIASPAISNAFNTTIISNTYKDGKGIITFYGDVTTIGYRAFFNCNLITNIILPNSVKTIEEQAFYNCGALTHITIPYNVTTIEEEAFYNCGLTNIEIPNGVASIGDKAFYGCTALTKASIPGSLQVWGDYMFMSCENLADVIVNNGVTDIGTGAFYYCDNLTNIILPESLIKIGHGAFIECVKLSTITIPSGVTTIGENAFNGCKNLIEVKIPNGVTIINQCAFIGCSSLENIVLPSNLKTIQWAAFDHCVSLTEISLPKSLTTIYGYAFNGCTKLKNVYCNSLTPPAIGCTDDYGRWGAFDDNAAGRIIYVPTVSVSAYKSQMHWMDYNTNILGYDFE